MFQRVVGFTSEVIKNIQTIQVRQTIKHVSKAIENGIYKVLDVTMPRNPVTQRREFRFIPTWAENALGTAYYDHICPPSKMASSSVMTTKVSLIFNQLVKNCVRKDELQFEIRVMQDDTTVNAFCLPGGKVVITTAMLRVLEESVSISKKVEEEDKLLEVVSFEDKLAAVLGHEIGHACAGHGRRTLQLKLMLLLGFKAAAWTVENVVKHSEEQALLKEKQNRKAAGKPMTELDEKTYRHYVQERSGLLRRLFEGIHTVIGFFISLSYSRCHELEADKYGIKIASKAGYRPQGAIWLQHKFIEMERKKEGEKESYWQSLLNKGKNLLNTHPPSIERLQANRITVQTVLKDGPEVIYRSNYS